MEHTTTQLWRYGTAIRRAYWTAWVATLTFFAGFYTLLVPLPRYLAAAGLPDWQVGLVLGAFGVASLIGRPLAGVAADRWGARAVMLVSAAALLVGATGTPTTTHLVALFGLRLLQAIGYVGFTTAGTALVVRLTPPGERGRQLALFGAAANVAITLSPALASLLLASFPLALGFVLAGALALGAGLLAAMVPPAPAHSGPPTASGWTFPRQLWPSMLMAGLLGAGFAAFFQFAPILAERRGTVAAGTLYTVYGVSIIAVRLAGGRAIDRLGLAALLGVAIALVVAGLALAAVGVAAGWLMLAALLVAAGSGLYHPALLAHHAALLPGAPGRASAAFYVGFDLGIGLGSWLFGLALQQAGVAGLYGLAAAIALAALPLAPVLARLRRAAGI
jgi:predicted MFS family arabinose efflux permease